MFFKRNKASAFDYLVVGLGNPGMQYENTRHNIGFLALDRLCARYEARLTKHKHRALFGECRIDEKRVLLAKPQTFMNLSGESVVELLQFYKIPAERMIVLYDDISLDVGHLRIRRKGSDGGHNGVKNIIEQIGTDVFPRIKIGVGSKPRPDYDLKEWVLGKFTLAQAKQLDDVLDNAAEATVAIIEHDIDYAMNRYNR